jgi:heptosyltransferase II
MESIEDFINKLDEPRFLVIRLKPIGDMVLTTPVFRNIKKKYPDSIIDVVIYPSVYDIIKNNPYIDKIIILNKNFISKALFNMKSMFSHYHVVIDLINNPVSSAIAFFTDSEAIIGDKKSRNFFYDLKAECVDPVYSPIRSLKKLNVIGIDDYNDFYPEIFINGEDSEKAGKYYDSLNTSQNVSKEFVGIFTSAKYPSKTYPPEYFAKLGELIAVNTGYNVLFLFGKNDFRTFSEVRRRIKIKERIFFHEPTTGLGELCAIISKLSFFITSDTGPKHISTALNIPTLTIFGPTSDKKWNPPDLTWFPVIRKEMPCSPCHSNHCPSGTMSCMKELLPEEVFSAFIKTLSSLELITENHF